MGPRASELDVGAKIDVAYRLERDEWNGESRLQARLADFRSVIDADRRGQVARAPHRRADGRRVRPTGDRVREAWMSIVNPWLAGARVLDLFAGSGALGFEALSRGADVVDFVEQSPQEPRGAPRQRRATRRGPEAVIHRGDAMRFASSARSRTPTTSRSPIRRTTSGSPPRSPSSGLRRPFADILGIEHRVNEKLPGDGERRKYGGTVITMF